LPKQSNMHATPVSTALGKRPLETPASSDSQPPTAKAPRVDTDILLATLKEAFAALEKVDGEALSVEQIQELSGFSSVFYRMRSNACCARGGRQARQRASSR